MNDFLQHNLFALMPVFPFLGWIINILFGKRLKEPTPAIIASLMVFISFVIALIGFSQVLNQKEAILDTVRWAWLPGVGGAGQALEFGFSLDRLSSLMTLIITGVGFLIHVFAAGYMHGDTGFSRFFAYLNFFVAMMLILVLGDSYPVLFVGWEGVGVASYLLIGFWYTDFANSDAARKAFVVNRIGDAFFMLAMFLMFRQFGTLNIHDIAEATKGLGYGIPVLEVIAGFLILGAAGKSAQLPLSTWLPDAMAGPTPVSALIHAATMVTAGVYLVARSSFIFSNAPLASSWLAWIGALTALYGALSAVAQTDIKKILAYSTVSQLGYMFLAVGVGAYWAGIFHVMTHAFFKALLFLSSGSVIHAVEGEQDVRQMGGLAKKLPTTHLVSLIGVIAISGIPILSGFWSKDAILAAAFSSPFARFEGIGNYLLWGMGLIVAGLTAGYMWRWYVLVFQGDYRGHAHPHESPAVMTLPLWVLAVLSVIGGFVGLPHLLGKNINWLEHFLEEVAPNAQGFAEIPASLEWGLIAAAVVAAIIGILVTRSFFMREGAMRVANVNNRFGAASRKALYLDDTYNLALGQGSKAISLGLEYADQYGLDVGVVATANGVAESGSSLRLWQSGFARAYAVGILLATALLVLFVALRSFS